MISDNFYSLKIISKGVFVRTPGPPAPEDGRGIAGESIEMLDVIERILSSQNAEIWWEREGRGGEKESEEWKRLVERAVKRKH